MLLCDVICISTTNTNSLRLNQYFEKILVVNKLYLSLSFTIQFTDSQIFQLRNLIGVQPWMSVVDMASSGILPQYLAAQTLGVASPHLLAIISCTVPMISQLQKLWVLEQHIGTHVELDCLAWDLQTYPPLQKSNGEIFNLFRNKKINFY